MEMEKLTVYHYAMDGTGDRRITLSPGNITLLAAAVEDITFNNRSLRPVTVMFLDGSNVDILVNHSDLDMLESVVGAYSFE